LAAGDFACVARATLFLRIVDRRVFFFFGGIGQLEISLWRKLKTLRRRMAIFK